jgi:UPF0716 family protein affecting phage T7 exclusion
MKLTSNQKQLSISVPMFIFSFMALYLTYPSIPLSLVLWLPFIVGIGWTAAILVILFSQSKFAKWLLRDDK